MLAEASSLEYVQWEILLLVPIAAVVFVFWVFGSYTSSNARERRHERDIRYDLEFRNWWRMVLGHRGLVHVHCPFPIGEGETSYAFFRQVSVYTPRLTPHGYEMLEEQESGASFDVPCGVSVSLNWSVLDWFSTRMFLGHADLCVTDCGLYLNGGNVRMRIDLDDIHTVAASCSSILVGSRTHGRPILITSLSAQIVRDTLHLLIDGDGTLMQGPPAKRRSHPTEPR